jgi:nucleotide-binding universal stress UspA family protein
VAEPLVEPASPADPTAVLAPAPVGALPIDTSELHRNELENAKAFLSDRAIDASFVLERGLPAEAIVDTAEREGADLIVVGTREPGFLERLLRGSVSAGVARSARCDVLIVH